MTFPGLSVFRWLAHSPLNAAMNKSVWAFAVIEMGHLVALAVLGGASLVLSLRVIGIWLKDVEATAVARSLRPVLAISLGVLILSGLLLLSSAPLKYYFNVAFRAKMLLLLLALASNLAMLLLIDRPAAVASKAALPALAALSLLLWLGVGVCGRLIGLI